LLLSAVRRSALPIIVLALLDTLDVPQSAGVGESFEKSAQSLLPADTVPAIERFRPIAVRSLRFTGR